MSYEEMQKLMDFIRETNARTDVKLQQLNIGVDAKPVPQTCSDKKWEQTEKRIRVLLARAKTTERRIVASRRRSLPLRKTATDRRLKALSDLVERQIRERRKGTA